MKVVQRRTLLRPNNISRKTPNSRTEAATETVRLEFERARLMRDLNAMDERRKLSTTALTNVNKRLKQLQDMLALPVRHSGKEA
jgi:hypothetical protein